MNLICVIAGLLFPRSRTPASEKRNSVGARVPLASRLRGAPVHPLLGYEGNEFHLRYCRFVEYLTGIARDGRIFDGTRTGRLISFVFG